MESETSFGQWLQQRRRALDLTQNELGQCAGCSGGTIRKIEADERRPSKEGARRLADCLRIETATQPAFIQFARGETSMLRPAAVQHHVPSERSPVHMRAQLPVPTSRLIGREQALAEVCALLERADVRLVVITGPGGIGKTRVGLAVVAQMSSAFADGLRFVSLGPVSDPALVLATIGQALEIKETSEQPLAERLREYFQDAEMLLLLDNFEQVVAAAPVVADLLAGAPRLKLLVTSRAALELAGEFEYPLPPLGLPALEEPLTRDVVGQAPAAQLFVQRVQALKPDFRLTDTNARAIVQICYWLDGLPLALELAAARSKVLPPAAMADRLERRFRAAEMPSAQRRMTRLGLLIGGARNLAERHQTLRTTLDWSYTLLSISEQTLFAQLAVFVDGGALAAIEVICAADGTQEADVLSGVESLVNKSLLRQVADEGGESRFLMLETLREYALEQLMLGPHAQTMHQRHADFFLALTAGAARQLRGPAQTMALAQLEQEHGNCRAALAWLVAQGAVDDAARLASGLVDFWLLRGYSDEGCRWLERVGAQTREGTPTWAGVVHGLGRFAQLRGDYATAQHYLSACAAFYQEREDGAALAAVLISQGTVARSQNHYAAAQTYFAQSLALARTLGDSQGIALALISLGAVAASQAKHGQARALFEESLQLYRALGDLAGIALAVYRLATIDYAEGDDTLAQARFEESLAKRRELGDKWGIAYALINLGLAALRQGEYTAARAHFEQSHQLFKVLGDKNGIALALNNLGELARATGDAPTAHDYYANSLAYFRKLGTQKNIALAACNLGFVTPDMQRARVLFEESLTLGEALDDAEQQIVCLIGIAGVLVRQHNTAGALRLLGTVEQWLAQPEHALYVTDAQEYRRLLTGACAELDDMTATALLAAGRELTLQQVSAALRADRPVAAEVMAALGTEY